MTTASGLRYKEIVPGKGPNPAPGFQIVVDYIAMTAEPELRVFDSSLEKGRPYDIRVADVGDETTVIKGLNEGLLTMRPGGVRRLYIPGDLAFPNGLPSAPGRPRVMPAAPVVFDVALRYIPGLDDLE